LLKDFKDIKGDKMKNKTTLPIQIGEKNTLTLAIAGTIPSFFGLILAYSRLMNTTLLVPAILGVLLASLVYVESQVIKTPEKAFSLARVNMLFIVLVLLFSSQYISIL
jgi:4-hydroxybenzoate polyprenyltransferase